MFSKTEVPLDTNPDISFIIPVYNMADTLPDALDSITEIRDLDIDIEIIVVDDGSDDGVADVLKRYSENLNKIPAFQLKAVHSSNRGRADARNTGIGMAHGEYISFLDADDEIDPAEFTKLWSCRNQSPSADLIIGQFKIVSDNGNAHSKREVNTGHQVDNILNKFAYSALSPIHLNAILIKKSVLNGMPLFNREYKYAMDKEFTLRLLKKTNDAAICNSFHYLYKKHDIGRVLNFKKRIMWLLYRQKMINANYTGVKKLQVKALQFFYDLMKLAYELVFGYKKVVR